MLSRSQPPSVNEVGHLLDEAENPFEVTSGLRSLPANYNPEYPSQRSSPKR